MLETKNGKEKLGIIPCGNETFDRLINISGKDAYMLSEEMILHYVPEVFKDTMSKQKHWSELQEMQILMQILCMIESWLSRFHGRTDQEKEKKLAYESEWN